MADDDFSLCMMNNARKAARAVSRRYDRLVRHFGLKAAQFSVLILIREGEGETSGELAARLAMDRTTLLRNIALLEKKGLARGKPAESGRGRTYELTERGAALLEQAIPLWRQAQADLQNEMGADAFADTIRALKTLSTV